MPVKYRIDTAAGIVHTQASGELTDDEVLAYQRDLKADPEFDPSYREFFDFSEVTPFSVTPSGIRSLSLRSPWGPDAARAFVAHSSHTFGMLRMLQSLLDPNGGRIVVVRTTSEAWRWLENGEEGPEPLTRSAPGVA